jgi:hypothetical protein
MTVSVVVQRQAEGPHGHDPVHEAKRGWVELYGPLLAEQLAPYERYTLLHVGDVQYAYTSYDRCVRALREAWDAGFVPRLGKGGVRGVELSDLAPRLQGVDSDLTELGRADTESRRRFPPAS